jgi:surfeit locus 1 family protein
MSFRPLPVLTIATVLALGVLVALGVWQLERRTEKHAFLARIAERSAMAPAPIEILLATGNYAAHRPATAQGTYIAGNQAYVFAPRTDKGPTVQGYKRVSAFALASGGTILVDEGWVTAEWRERADASAQRPDEVEIEGVLRPATAAGAFTPPPDAAKRVVFVRDSASIANLLDLTLKTPLVFELTAPTGENAPEPLPYAVDVPDNHLNYALTWFSLALVLLVVYLRYHYVRGRLEFAK